MQGSTKSALFLLTGGQALVTGSDVDGKIISLITVGTGEWLGLLDETPDCPGQSLTPLQARPDLNESAQSTAYRAVLIGE